MTAALVSIALVFHPQVAPVSPSGSEGLNRPAALTQAAELVPQREEVPSWLLADAMTAEPKPLTLSASLNEPLTADHPPAPASALSLPELSAGTDLPAPNDSPDSAPPTYPELAPIEVGMNRLAELGATGWQLRTFGCLAWYESKNNPYAVSSTNDHGLWQINRRFHAWRWAGRDVYDPTVNAELAWDIYRESGFRAWTTARFCGV